MKGDGLSEEQHEAIQMARRAFGETLAANAVSDDEMAVLAMVGHAGAFADLLCAARATGMAQAILDVANRQLASAGCKVVTVRQ